MKKVILISILVMFSLVLGTVHAGLDDKTADAIKQNTEDLKAQNDVLKATIDELMKKVSDTSKGDAIASDVKSILSKQNLDVTMHGTEYVVGDTATAFLQLTNDSSVALNGGSCNMTAYFPNKTVYARRDMIYLSGSEGLYYADLAVPEAIGVYMMSASCRINLNLTTGQPTNDTYVIPNNPSNFGSSASMIIGDGGVPPSSWGFASFNLTSIDSNIISRATLYLYRTSAFGNLNMTVRRVTSGWSEMNLTGVNMPTIAQPILNSKVTALGWNSFDITEAVRGWKNGTYQNFGIMFNHSTLTGGNAFYSSKEGSYAPFIQVLLNTSMQVQELKGSGELHVSSAIACTNFNITNNYTNNYNTTSIQNYTYLFNTTNNYNNTLIQNYSYTFNNSYFYNYSYFYNFTSTIIYNITNNITNFEFSNSTTIFNYTQNTSDLKLLTALLTAQLKSNHDACYNSSTLLKKLTFNYCIDSTCSDYVRNELLPCDYGCYNNACINRPEDRTMLLGGLAVLVIAVLFLLGRWGYW